MATFTTRYSFIKPTPNSTIDANKWGAQLNEGTISKIDTYLYNTALSNIGNTAPTVPALAPGLEWIDKNGDSTTQWFMKVYDGSAWILTGTINPTTHQYTPANVTAQIINVQQFTVNGVYTPTPGMTYCIVRMVGGGAGGSTLNASTGAGAGGGSGEYRESLYTSAQVGVSATVIVGSGGAPNVNGGSSTFNAVSNPTTAGGGSAPSIDIASGSSGAVQLGGLGGGIVTTGNGGYLVVPGANGQYGLRVGQFSGSVDTAGNGGNSILGSGGRGGISPASDANKIGQPGQGYGAGGGGGANGSGGGIGSNGIIIITEYISS